jgi:SAM-dependent methyltransferase
MAFLQEAIPLKQRADYTYRHNAKTGRHGWLRLTPAYSLKIVEEIISNQPKSTFVFDPFCGTGTTALTAAYFGNKSVTTDINPFLLWLAKAKTRIYTNQEIENTKEACKTVIDLVKKQKIEPLASPPIHNIERWWKPDTLHFLQLLLASIKKTVPENSAEQTLLQVGFCRSLIQLSNAAFNHQSMSFKNSQQLELEFEEDKLEQFSQNIHFVLSGAEDNPLENAKVIYADATEIGNFIKEKFDLVITSPPYVNRMSYIRELRPYMYWLGYLLNGRDAGELDWQAIGGTWGIATSRLTDWERPTNYFKSQNLDSVIEKISQNDNKNGKLLSQYVEKYFQDMWSHFKGLPNILSSHAQVHYIVGNSTFYGNLVSAELIYAEMLKKLGFSNIKAQPIRKRNSKKDLVEFDVTASWK